MEIEDVVRYCRLAGYVATNGPCHSTTILLSNNGAKQIEDLLISLLIDRLSTALFNIIYLLNYFLKLDLEFYHTIIYRDNCNYIGACM